MSKKKLVISSGTLAIAAVAVVSFSLFGGQSPRAYAEQLTQQSLSAVSQLTPVQQQALNQRLSVNATADLQTAEQAPDLTVLTYDQFVAQYPQIQQQVNSTNTPPPAGTQSGSPTTINIQSLKFLKYSDSQGNIHILGVGSDNLPVIEMVFNSDGMTSVQVHGNGFESGSSSLKSSGASANGSGIVHAPATTSCTSVVGGGMTCTSGSAVSGSDPANQQ